MVVGMSVIQGTTRPKQSKPESQRIQPGDVVIVWEHPELINSASDAWWLGEVISMKSDSSHPTTTPHYQVADIDTGLINWCHRNCLQKVHLPMTSPFSKVIPIEQYF